MTEPLPDFLGLDDLERQRFLAACRSLGTSYREFAKHAVLQAIDELEGTANMLRRVRP